MKALLISSLLLTTNPATTDYKTLRTEITIDAPAAKVWEVLTDFSHYSDWNPMVKKFEGTPELGKTIKVFIQPPNQSGMKFTPKVMAWNVGEHFAWKGKLWMGGLFDGEHHFQIIPIGPNVTKLVQSENFSGILVPLFKKMILTDTKDGFNKVNEVIKQRAEAAVNNQ